MLLGAVAGERPSASGDIKPASEPGASPAVPGSAKTVSSERVVPLHQAVLDAGFVAFVRGLGAGPLFAELSRDKFGQRGGNGIKILGRRVAVLGWTKSGWLRHTAGVAGAALRLAEDVTRALMEHGKRGVAEGYGEFEPAVNPSCR